tara:strand:- start:1799 stop:3304 length:1506 start_codon:yes stop_codon:yes gene_type:complete
MKNNIFKDLYVLDLANNHFGDVSHAKKIITSFGKIANKKKLNCTIKFQLRNYETYIHKKYLNSDNHYVKRFMDTKLSIIQFKDLFDSVKRNKLLTSCTPFDEESIDVIEKFKFDFLKIASVSSNDFSLLRRAVKNKIPKIISTGGLNFNQIDKIVRLMTKYKQKFALMHCVAIYPSANQDLQLSVIKELKKRFPNIDIGWSTHEEPTFLLPSSIAITSGATILERHIGITNKKYKLNKYSMTPEIFNNWVDNIEKTKIVLGPDEKKISLKERITLKTLQRGVYAKDDIKKGSILSNKNSYLAFPLNNNQLSAQDLQKKAILKKTIKKDSSIEIKNVQNDTLVMNDLQIWSYIHEVKAILNYNKISIGDNFNMEISHHHGIKKFRKVGAFLFNIINKEYAKKIIVMLPSQKHPNHSHKKKSESFYIISGELNLKMGGKMYKLLPGQTIDVKKNMQHEFKAGKLGCIFDEISTTSFNHDSFYIDKKIKNISRSERKTFVNSWC